MNRRSAFIRRTACKFPGMTRAEYDVRLNALLSMCRPRLRIGPGLDINGLPGLSAMSLLAAVKRVGASVFSGGMYRKAERPKTQAREMARRLRQRGLASA